MDNRGHQVAVYEGNKVKQSRRERLEAYLRQIENVAHDAEASMAHIDEPGYREILKKEVDGYRELIRLWKARLKLEPPR